MANPSIIITAVDQASPAIAQIRSRLGDLLQGFSGFGSLANTLSLPLLGVSAAIAGIGAAVANAVNVTRWVDDLADAGSALGITAENMAKYQILAQQAGVESAALSASFVALSRAVEGARAGQAEQIEMFRRFGVSIKEVKTLSPDELLVRMAKASGQLESGFAKVSLQAEAFAKGGKRIDDMLQKLASGMEVNTGLSKDFVERSQELNRELDLLSIAWTKYKTLLAGPVVDALLLVGRAMGFIEKKPAEQREALVSQIEKLELRIRERQSDAEKSGNRPWDSRFNEGNLQLLKKAREELALLDQQMERMSSRDAPGQVAVPEKIDTAAIDAARKRAQSAAEAARKVQLAADKQAREDLRKAEDDLYEDNLRFDERNLERTRRHNEAMQELFFKIDKEQQEAIERGAEVVAQRRSKAIDEVEEKIQSLTSVTESFFLRLDSFQGEDVFKTLGKDLAQLAYRLLILEPILDRIRAAMRAIATEKVDSGGSWISLLLKAVGMFFGGGNNAAVAAGAFDAALGGPANFAQVVGEAGPELFIPKSAGTIIPNHMMSGMGGGVTIINNNVIDSRTDQGTIAAMLEANRQATLREVREQLARRGSLLRV